MLNTHCPATLRDHRGVRKAATLHVCKVVRYSRYQAIERY